MNSLATRIALFVAISMAATSMVITTCGAYAQDSGSGMTFDISNATGQPSETSSSKSSAKAEASVKSPTNTTKTLKGKTTTTILEGKIEHSQSLAPVESGLKAGLTFDINNLPKLVSGNEWYQLPDWLCGKFKSEKDTQYYHKELSSGLVDHTVSTYTAIHTGTSGFQTDKLGHIWEYEYAPYKTMVEGDTTYSIQLIRKRKPIEILANRATFLYIGTIIKVSKIDNQIVRTYQNESIQTYTPAGPNKVKCAASMKIFDENGQPTAIARLVGGELRVSPYRRIDRDNGKDLRKSFRDFLVSHNLEHLIPDYLAADLPPPPRQPQALKLKAPAKKSLQHR